MTESLLPTRLRLLRAEKGLTLRAAAKATGVAKETLSALERGQRRPHDPTLAKIAKGYGVPVEELLDESAGPLVEAPRDSGQAPGDEEVYDPRLSDVRRLKPLRMLASLAMRYVDMWESGLEEYAKENPLVFIGWATAVLQACRSFVQLRTEDLRDLRSLAVHLVGRLPREEQEAQNYLDSAIAEMVKVVDRISEQAKLELKHVSAGHVTTDSKREAQEIERRFREVVSSYESTRVEVLAG